MKPGSVYALTNLRAKTNPAVVMWDVEGLMLDNGQSAHFTVHFGPRPATEFEHAGSQPSKPEAASQGVAASVASCLTAGPRLDKGSAASSDVWQPAHPTLPGDPWVPAERKIELEEIKPGELMECR